MQKYLQSFYLFCISMQLSVTDVAFYVVHGKILLLFNQESMSPLKPYSRGNSIFLCLRMNLI